MSYTALYRKFRPQEFRDVKGQDHIVTTLRNQIEAGRIGHAYLFCGTRGTGKTSVAKIFAKAVNCETPDQGSPCGHCRSCRAIADGSSLNVIEIDAASNNGVENIRDIKEEVAYSPAEGKYKVYIIDEVHMLSIGAFNALLKTLEEPPSYVIFILATTEVHKIPVTILSRCQRYDFKRISAATIGDRLTELMAQEGIEAEEKAVSYLARSADGALRDALSLLDQCVAFYLGQKLSYENVLQVLGAVDTEVFSSLLRCVLKEDVKGVVMAVERLITDGRELGQFVTDFTWYLRNLLLLKSSGDMEGILDLSEENLVRLREESEMISDEDLLRYIRIFSELTSQIKYATQKRVMLEVALIKLCRPQMEADISSLAGRIAQIEKKIEKGVPMAAQPAAVRPDIPVVAVNTEQTQRELPKALPEDIQKAVKGFRTIVSQMPGLSKTYLSKARLSMGANQELIVFFEDTMAAAYFNREEEKQNLENAVEHYLGKQIGILIQSGDSGQRFEDTHADLEQIIHMDITYEENED